jgi:hypothetical protein
MKTLIVPLCLSLLVLTACAPERGFPPIYSPPADAGLTAADPGPTLAEAAAAASVATCAGTDILALVGQNVSALPATGSWSTVRILTPGSTATMDYSPTRLNVSVDNAGTITAISCG